MTKPTPEQQAETATLLDEYLQRKQPKLTEVERKAKLGELLEAFSVPPPVGLPPPEERQ